MSGIEGLTPLGRDMSEPVSGVRAWLALTKPGVVVLLQITALCAVLSHDLLDSNEMDWLATIETMMVVFVGGYLTAGGANAINMWYDRDIDPIMSRTSNRPIPSGAVTANGALTFGIFISIIGTYWFIVMANTVAAFWAAFSILFYVLIYTIWLKRTSTQNIVIGGIAGATPPVIGWATAAGELSIEIESVQSFVTSITDLGSLMPWFMFLLIFLWTPPHFWALALYRSEEYEKVGVPMMPGVKGAQRTLIEMKFYAILLVLLSLAAPITLGGIDIGDELFHIFGWNAVIVSLWYTRTVFIIDPNEPKGPGGRIPSATNSFFVSMYYLAVMFVIVVTASFGLYGGIIGAVISLAFIIRYELRSRVNRKANSA